MWQIDVFCMPDATMHTVHSAVRRRCTYKVLLIITHSFLKTRRQMVKWWIQMKWSINLSARHKIVFWRRKNRRSHVFVVLLGEIHADSLHMPASFTHFSCSFDPTHSHKQPQLISLTWITYDSVVVSARKRHTHKIHLSYPYSAHSTHNIHSNTIQLVAKRFRFSSIHRRLVLFLPSRL